MLTVFPAAETLPADGDGDLLAIAPPAAAMHKDALWVDMVNPDEATRHAIADATGLEVPTREDLSEIESSSRLYRQGDVLYMSMPSLLRTEAGDTRTSPVGFVLARDRLLTVRFSRLPAFETYAARCRSGANADRSSASLMLGLCETVIERIADVLEREAEGLDQVSHRIFRNQGHGRVRPRRTEIELRAVLRNVGRIGDLLSKIREMLLGLGRMVPFVLANAPWITSEQRTRFKSLRADINSLSDFVGHLSTKVQFLLDATLGFIGIEQSNIIRVLTVVSVVGVPPTFFASMYGMNFKFMPELEWSFGYPMALVLIVLSAVLPLVWFRLRGWM